MDSDINQLVKLTIPDLKKYATALRFEIKTNGGVKSNNDEVKKLTKKLETVKSAIAKKTIFETEQQLVRNHIAGALKKPR